MPCPMDYVLKNPVLYLSWNRPHCVKYSLARIRLVKPSRLYISSDGFVSNKQTNAKVIEARQLIFSIIDWDCQVFTRFSETNLGCRSAISSALDWFFSCESQGIVIEDDVVCEPTFFRFCDEMLELYQHNEKIGSISGNCFNQHLTAHPEASYSFSAHPHVWGWATWRRTWQYYDVDLSSFSPIRDFFHFTLTKGPLHAVFWTHTLLKVASGSINTWDYQLSYCFYKRNLLSIVPSLELVENIGFTESSTHQHNGTSPLNPSIPLAFPLNHPTTITASTARDRATFASNYFPPIRQLLALKILNLLK